MRTSEYIEAALRLATYERLGDGTIYAEVPGLDGVWANADTQVGAEVELSEVIEEWIYLRLSKQLPIPSMGGIEIKPPAIA